jgi:drug/metabolite transporter (DMT)-like permease
MATPAAPTASRAGALAATLGVVAAAACWGIAAIMAKVAFGACVGAVNYAYYLAIDHLTVGVAISLQYTGPVLVLGWTVLVARGRPTRLAWIAAGCTLAGAVLVSEAVAGFGGVDATGLAGGFASAVLFAAYLLTAEASGRAGVRPATVLLWGFISAATAGIAATFEPVFAASFAWLLLGQRLAPPQLAGGLLVVVGVMLAQLAQPRSRASDDPGAPAEADLHA